MKTKQLIYTQETARALNDAARHQMICRLYADILQDLMVCEIEGWDKREYIGMLRERINSIKI